MSTISETSACLNMRVFEWSSQPQRGCGFVVLEEGSETICTMQSHVIGMHLTLDCLQAWQHLQQNSCKSSRCLARARNLQRCCGQQGMWHGRA